MSVLTTSNFTGTEFVGAISLLLNFQVFSNRLFVTLVMRLCVNLK